MGVTARARRPVDAVQQLEILAHHLTDVPHVLPGVGRQHPRQGVLREADILRQKLVLHPPEMVEVGVVSQFFDNKLRGVLHLRRRTKARQVECNVRLRDSCLFRCCVSPTCTAA